MPPNFAAGRVAWQQDETAPCTFFTAGRDFAAVPVTLKSIGTINVNESGPTPDAPYHKTRNDYRQPGFLRLPTLGQQTIRSPNSQICLSLSSHTPLQALNSQTSYPCMYSLPKHHTPAHTHTPLHAPTLRTNITPLCMHPPFEIQHHTPLHALTTPCMHSPLKHQ